MVILNALAMKCDDVMEPQRKKQSRNREAAVFPNPRDAQQSRPGGRPIVLVIEDSEDDFYLLHRAFKKLEDLTEMRHLRDGTEAIHYLAEAKQNSQDAPALLLLDLKMPGTSGFEVLKWVRDDPVFKLLPVNVLSSSAESADVQKAFELGANAYTVKPMSLQEYDDLVATLLKFWLDLGKLPRPSPYS